MVRNPLIALIALALSLPLLACEDRPDAATADEPTAYDIPFRTDAQLASQLVDTCLGARDAGKPMLLEFSAAWCSDCRKLHEMKQEPALAAELEDWEILVVNVGRFDRHRPLLAALEIESIAHWEVLATSGCDKQIVDWPSLARRTLEVTSGDAQDLTPRQLARWLEQIRIKYRG